MEQYETVIGLEVHVELSTESKIFCSCSTKFGSSPNSNICPVCVGMPGAMPVLNKKVVEYALAAAIALDCEINKTIIFDRKNYFYPDLPKGFQISQFYLPIGENGKVTVNTENGTKIIGIREIHIEEDAGKLVHDTVGNKSFVDFNRAGIPLIEIVSKPDIRSADEAVAYLEKLKMIMTYLGVSDCKMQEGSLRVDINLSVRKAGDKMFGTRTEIKNLNSFKAVYKAIESESKRHIELLKEGKEITRETRRWDDSKNMSIRMRAKEETYDYCYFIEPDLGPIVICDDWINEIKSSMPEFRDEKIIRYQKEYNLPEYDAKVLTSSKKMADLFESTTDLCNKPKQVANWLMVDGMRILNDKGLEVDDLNIQLARLSKLILMVEEGKINRTVAKEVFEKVFLEDTDPEEYVTEHNLGLITDENMLRALVKTVLEENPKSVSDFKSGKEKAFGFLVGQTMKAVKGQADPVLVNKILSELLNR
ncbi:MAG TPA: Asp-tRNA(Asn)/Glu-tRNA(Gln) amidotransferase subunit GatB [Mobilitalea sp.]|nr:Asp-tRNA(Asn)/Glu-tRNA(Gln) amidotransferase subunit GatB [Mobilitalea sp.]